MGLEEARSALESLVREAVEQVVTSEEALFEQRGAIAIYDTSRDAKFRDLESFESAATTVAVLPNFDERIGAQSAERVTLQIVYNYFATTTHLDYDADAFAYAFDGFASELAKPTWTLVMVANLKYFESPDTLIDFGDGMSIRARSFNELQQRLGWNDQHLEALKQDWMGFGASGHVIWIEEEAEKSPETLVLSNTATGLGALSRLLLALRLHKDGDLNIGSIFNAESASFSLRGGGLGRSILPGPGFGDRTYALTASEVPKVRSVYDSLERFDEATDVPPNVRLAFRRFSSIYARGLHQREDRILDSITALEALLGARDELAFKLSFRIASILADDDNERVELLSEMRRFYATRSRIVHGDTLRQQHLDLVTDDTPLRVVLRRVLCATLHLAVEHGRQLSQRFIDEDLDRLLIHVANRQALRREMGLTT